MSETSTTTEVPASITTPDQIESRLGTLEFEIEIAELEEQSEEAP